MTRASKFGKNLYKGRMTPKMGNKNFYKGRGCKPMGRHTSKAKYVIEPHRIPFLEVPDLAGFELKPYVSKRTPKFISDNEGNVTIIAPKSIEGKQ